MRVDPWVDRKHFPATLWSGGDALCLVPLLFRNRYFCTNVHGIHWTIGAIFVKFSQLILMKIIATTQPMSNFKAKIH